MSRLLTGINLTDHLFFNTPLNHIMPSPSILLSNTDAGSKLILGRRMVTRVVFVCLTGGIPPLESFLIIYANFCILLHIRDNFSRYYTHFGAQVLVKEYFTDHFMTE